MAYRIDFVSGAPRSGSPAMGNVATDAEPVGRLRPGGASLRPRRGAPIGILAGMYAVCASAIARRGQLPHLCRLGTRIPSDMRITCATSC
jgi:hypothetical protein